MSEINQSALLAEMQKLVSEAQSGLTQVVNPEQDTFVKQLHHAINEVNNQQLRTHELATRFEYGDDSVSLSEVMIALQKSNIALNAMTQVRNKLVSAYQEIMNMPI